MVDKAKSDKTVKYWNGKIDKAELALKEYFKEAERAADAARNTGTKPHEFAIQWTNTHILRSAVYGSRPKPDIRRRFQKADQDEKSLAQMVERGIEFSIDTEDFDTPSDYVVRDYIEVGLGVPRVVYDVVTEKTPDVTEDFEAEPTYKQELTEIVSQSIGIEHVPWNHFLWEPGKSWKHVDWIAYKSYRSRTEVEDEYDVSLQGGEESDARKRKAEEFRNEIVIWEIYYKPTRTVYVITPSHDTPLDVYKDPLKLQGFFPSPHPLFANLKHDELIPRPDYMFIEKQVVELNRITGRILSLTSQIKDVAFYDSTLGDGLATAMTAKDGSLIPVNNMAATGFANLQAALGQLPMTDKIQVIQALMQQRELVIKQIYEVVGISDIIRGSSEKQETATAQQIKGQWAGIRLSEKIGEVSRIWREVFRMFAEILCEHFEPQQLYLMTGIEVTPRMQEMMQSDVGRAFAIDVETDSTIAQDDAENRQQTMDLVEMLVNKLAQLVPGVQSGMLPIGLVQEILIFSISSHKHGKQLEDAIHELKPHLEGLQQFQQQMQGLQQQLQEAMQKGQEVSQQAQGMQQALSKVNEREEARKDAEAARKDAEVKAKVGKEIAEAEAQQIENQIVARGLDIPQQMAEIEQTRAETDKTRRETAFIGVVNG